MSYQVQALFYGKSIILQDNISNPLNEKVIDIEYVENVLNQAVSLSFFEETFMLKKVELEAMIRRKGMVWVTSLPTDWEFED